MGEGEEGRSRRKTGVTGREQLSGKDSWTTAMLTEKKTGVELELYNQSVTGVYGMLYVGLK